MDEPGGSKSGSVWRLQPAAANESGTEKALSPNTRLLLEAVVVLMCLGAVTGNILVIVIVAATKSLQSVTSVLIMNLAISDLLVGIGVMPFVALSVMDSGWVQWTDLCLYVGFTSSVYCTASVLTLAAIALDRYHSIMDCLRYSSRCTLWRTCAVVLWIWLQALFTSTPPLLGWCSFSYAVPMYICAVDWASSPSYTAVIAAVSYLMPAVVILFCYVNIVKVARCHARRIHTLEDSVQRSSTPCGSPHQHPGSLNNPWRLIFPINGRFVSRVRTEEGHTGSVPPEAATQQSSSQPPVHNSQQHHHGVARLLLLISAFLICWTPYISTALVQATETAISGQSTLVPRPAITFSYWLVLLNSGINPLLYALLSKRFQSALCGLVQKIRTHLQSVFGRKEQVRTEGDDLRTSDPCTLTTANASPHSSMESLTSDKSKYSSSVFTISAGFKCHTEEHVCHCENTPTSSVWGEAGGERKDKLQVPPRPQERSRLPFSALTKERQATFFFGQITVKVEHDFC